MRSRVLILLACFIWLRGAAAASSALFRVSGPDAPVPVSVQTYAGKVEIRITPVQVSSQITFVLLMDSIPAAQLPTIKAQLLAAYTPARGAKMRLGLVQSGNLVFAGPFPTRLRFKAALDEIHAPVGESTPAVASALVETIFNNAAHFGSDWSSAVFIGELPNAEPAGSDYAIALLAGEFAVQHVRVNWLTTGVATESWLPFLVSTGGGLAGSEMRDFARFFDDPGTVQQIDWVTPPPTAGFVLTSSAIQDTSGAVLMTVPEIAVAAGATLPGPTLYNQLRARAAETTALLEKSGPPSAEIVEQSREDLKLAFAINPRDPEALLDSATLSERLSDFTGAAVFRASLVEVRPLDATTRAALGHDYLLARDLEKAEGALQSALQLGGQPPFLMEDLARIRIARKDDLSAIPFLEKALNADPKRQDLWFIKGQAAARLNDSVMAMAAYESGLALGGIQIEETKALLRIYIGAGQKEKAARLAASTLEKLPANVDTRTQFASAVDGLHMDAEALAAWRKVLDIQAESRIAHEHIARLLLRSADYAGAVSAADLGLSVAPGSPDLYLSKAEALEKMGHVYQARQTLEQGVEAAPADSLLEQLANLQETFAGLAAPTYELWAAQPDLPAEERVRVLQRGFAVSLRDQDLKHARAFAASLNASGHADAGELLGNEASTRDGAMILGGLAALGFAARAKERVSPDRFFVEFCRALLDHAGPLADQKQGKQYLEGVEQYLERVASLESMGKKDAQGMKINLSLQDKDARARTQNVLKLLGVKLGSGKNPYELDFGENKSQSRKQETLGALGIDPVGMQEAFEKGKSYTLELSYERASIYPDEKLWHDAFFAHDNSSGGFSGQLLHSLNVARLYVGMSYLDRETIKQLLQAVDLRTLHDHYADLFYTFAAAFAIHDGQAVCPGGVAAAPIWERLVGASTRQPGIFFRALLQRDDGKMLAYFFTLSHLDRTRQSFFTANLARTEQFYRLFADSKDRQPGSLTTMRDASFPDFLRSVPIAENGHVDFPGSPAVWMVAKGHASAESKMSKLTKAGSQWVGTEVEDQVLLRLAQARYHEETGQHTELDNFLAVSRINAHRSEPLDEETALLLAQRYSDASSTYAYFTDLTSLTRSDFSQFFSLLDQIHMQPASDANLRLGQLHALVEWICLLRQRQRLSDQEATRLFRYVIQHFSSSSPAEGYAASSLDAARTILASCKPGQKATTQDELIRFCFAGTGMGRQEEFQQVMEMQKVPSFDSLLAILNATASPGDRGLNSAALNKAASGLPLAEVPPKSKMTGKEKEQIQRYNTSSLQKLVNQMIQRAAGGKSGGNDREKLRRELVHELEPQVTLALSGVVYAYYLRPSDLLISEDPLLLRKHRYIDFIEVPPSLGNPESAFNQNSGGAGSYFLGGFAEFAMAGGASAGARWKTGGESGTEAIAVQIAAIRSTPWDLLGESDLRLLGLRIAIAREWIMMAATNPEALRTLDDATLGELSLSRRADLLSGLAAHNWPRVWESTTLPDLFALGRMYPVYFKSDIWQSPVTSAFRAAVAGNDGGRLNFLGPVSYHSLGCGHAHWIPLAPYEEYEHRFFPRDNAERWAEFKLFLAFQTDMVGGEASALSPVAEKLAAKAFRAAQMTDFGDWRSLLAGYSSITTGDVKKALQQ